MAFSRTASSSMATTRALASSLGHCSSPSRFQISRALSTSLQLHSTSAPLPRVSKPSFWKSLIPKPFRQPASPLEAAARAERRARNSSRPKTDSEYIGFVVLALIIGSNAINMISLRNDTAGFRRKSDARIETLRDVLRRLKNGEEVDVKKELGTGDPVQEQEWMEVVEELAGRTAVGAAAARRSAERDSERVAKGEAEREKETRAGEEDGRDKTSRPKFIM